VWTVQDNSLQAYRRAYNALKEQILSHRLAGGQRLPCERELCREHGVSRITIRHALRLLEQDGLIRRRRGSGTFVRSLRAGKLPILNADFTGSMRSYAPNLERRVLCRRETSLPPRIAELLDRPEGQCLYAERLDVLEGKPVAYDRAYIPAELAGRIDEAMLVRVDFLQAWAQAEGLTISHGSQSVEAVAAGEDDALRLAISPGQPLLLATDVIYGPSSRALALFEPLYRGDCVKLVSTVREVRHDGTYSH